MSQGEDVGVKELMDILERLAFIRQAAVNKLRELREQSKSYFSFAGCLHPEELVSDGPHHVHCGLCGAWSSKYVAGRIWHRLKTDGVIRKGSRWRCKGVVHGSPFAVQARSPAVEGEVCKVLEIDSDERVFAVDLDEQPIGWLRVEFEDGSLGQSNTAFFLDRFELLPNEESPQ